MGWVQRVKEGKNSPCARSLALSFSFFRFPFVRGRQETHQHYQQQSSKRMPTIKVLKHTKKRQKKHLFFSKHFYKRNFSFCAQGDPFCSSPSFFVFQYLLPSPSPPTSPLSRPNRYIPHPVFSLTTFKTCLFFFAQRGEAWEQENGPESFPPPPFFFLQKPASLLFRASATKMKERGGGGGEISVS